MNSQHVFNLNIGIVGALATYLLGGWDTSLYVLAAFMLLDYITGVLYAYLQNKVNSQVGFKGILRKVEILIVLIVATLLDRLINKGTWVFRTVVCYYYIANEGISILENLGKTGVPYPERLFNALEQLKGNKEDDHDEKDSRHK